MKKGEIKRRKRVVPANLGDDSSSVYTNDMTDEERRSVPPAGDASTAPQGAGAFPAGYPATSNPQIAPPEALMRQPSGPIPVDFTSMYARRPTALQSDAKPSLSQSAVPRKRSFSAHAEDMTEAYPHAQNVEITRNENIDPALSSDEPHNLTNDKDAKKSELLAEAENMRRMLSEKEREIAALLAAEGS
jgi:hypothetical protein